MGQHLVREPAAHQLGGPFAFVPDAAQLITTGGQQRLAVVAGNSLLFLDPLTGQLSEAVPLDILPAQAVQWIDVEGDGDDDLVTLAEIKSTALSGLPQPRLCVWSSKHRQTLWSQPLDAYWPTKRGWTIDCPQWPLVADLEGDGKAEILVPNGRTHSADSFSGGFFSRVTPSGRLACLEAETGNAIWSTPWVSIDSQVDRFAPGPDIDGDGTDDIFVASLAGTETHLHVDAVSGHTGEILWGAKQPLSSTIQPYVDWQLGALQWWHAGTDGWSQLVVNVKNEHAGRIDSSCFLFSAGTGERMHQGDHIKAVRPVDLDHDRIEDLCVVATGSTREIHQPGTLHCVRGICGQPWKRLGSYGQPIADVDADGVQDLVQSWADGTLRATNGATGKELWRCSELRATSEWGIQHAGFSGYTNTFTVPSSDAERRVEGDLNDDGYVDLLVYETHISNRVVSPLHAVSGKSGRRLWTLQDVLVRAIDGSVALQSVDLDHDGLLEIVWLVAFDPQTESAATPKVQWMALVISGQTGKLQWMQPLSPLYDGLKGISSPIHFDIASLEVTITDLNGDDTLDLIVPALSEDHLLETRALDGKQGLTLWRRDRQPDGLGNQSLQNWTPATVCDFESDGSLEVVLIEPRGRANSGSIPLVDVAVTAVRADNGRLLWSVTTDCNFTHFHTYSPLKGSLLRPLVVRVGDGRQRIVVTLPGTEPQVMTFDQQGAVDSRRLKHERSLNRLLVCDGDGDQQDELYFVDQTSIYAVRHDSLDVPLWMREFTNHRQLQFIGMTSESETQFSQIVVATDAIHNVVLGLNATNGQTDWTCPGPITRQGAGGAYVTPQAIRYLGIKPGLGPLTLFQYADWSVCRSATTQDRLSGVAVTPANTSGIDRDSRWLRQLPWVSGLNEGRTELPRMIGWGLLFTATMLLLPLAYFGWLFKKRRIGLAYLLLFPLVSALFVHSLWMPAPAEYGLHSLSSRFYWAGAFAPPFCCVLLLPYWFARRRYRRLLFWLGFVTFFSLVATLLGIQVDQKAAPLLAQESYDWTGWYLILFPVSYATSWLMLATLLAEALRSEMLRRSDAGGEQDKKSGSFAGGVPLEG